MEVTPLEVIPAGCSSAQTPRPVQDLTLELCHGAGGDSGCCYWWGPAQLRTPLLLWVQQRVPPRFSSTHRLLCFAAWRGYAAFWPCSWHWLGTLGFFLQNEGVCTKGAFAALWPSPLLFCPPCSPEIRCCWKRALCPGFLPSRPSLPVYCCSSKRWHLPRLQGGCGRDNAADPVYEGSMVSSNVSSLPDIEINKRKDFKNNPIPAPERGDCHRCLVSGFAGLRWLWSARAGEMGAAFAVSSPRSGPRASSCRR